MNKRTLHRDEVLVHIGSICLRDYNGSFTGTVHELYEICPESAVAAMEMQFTDNVIHAFGGGIKERLGNIVGQEAKDN